MLHTAGSILRGTVDGSGGCEHDWGESSVRVFLAFKKNRKKNFAYRIQIILLVIRKPTKIYLS